MGGAKTVILYWSQSPQRVVSSGYAGKAWLFWDGLVHRQNGGSIVRLTLSDTPAALKDGLALAPAVIAAMERFLGG